MYRRVVYLLFPSLYRYKHLISRMFLRQYFLLFANRNMRIDLCSCSKEVSALEKAEKERSYHLLEEKKEFCYFCAGEDTKAQNFIGSILASTGLQISICDPYLDQIGLENYVKGWIRCEKLYLFVAGKWLRKIDAASGKTHQQQIEDIVGQMISNNEARQVKLFKITGGNNGFVHDRFIIVDENAWSFSI